MMRISRSDVPSIRRTSDALFVFSATTFPPLTLLSSLGRLVIRHCVAREVSELVTPRPAILHSRLREAR